MNPIDAVSKLRHIQINLKYALFRPQQFQKCRKVCLKPFPHVTAIGPQKEILGDLLGDCARSPEAATPLVFLHRLLDRLKVEAPMVGEFLVFSSNYRKKHVGRNRFPIYPSVANGGALFVLEKICEMSFNHKRACRRWDPSQKDDQYNGEGHSGKDCAGDKDQETENLTLRNMFFFRLAVVEQRPGSSGFISGNMILF